MSSAHSMICVDTSVLIRVLTNTAGPETVEAWDQWRARPGQMVAPSLLHFELSNVLHQYARAGIFQGDAVDRMVALAFRLPIEIVDDDDLHREALTAARRLGIASVYDAHYLALAERLGIALVTADARLYRRVKDAAPWVQLME